MIFGKTLGEIAGESTKTFEVRYTTSRLQNIIERYDFRHKVDENDCETVYAMCEDIDKINKLKLGQSMPFKPCRDDDNTWGYIIRIK